MADAKEAQEILGALGMPRLQRNKMSSLILIALCRLTPKAHWSNARREGCTITKGLMDFLKETYDTDYAPNTRETVRRQVLHQFVQARIADKNPFEPDLPTNSPRTHYAISEPALDVVRRFGAEGWKAAVADFRRKQGALAVRYARDRSRSRIPIRVPGGRDLWLSPGKHNELQKAVVEVFGPRFAGGASLLYLGDTENKRLVVDVGGLEQLGIPINDHDKLPDVVLYHAKRNWLFLIEAVTSHGPVSPSRLVDLEEMLAACPAGPVFVSAFPDFTEFRKHIRQIAWDTEVWLCDTPDHMIHFNGDRFLGPRQ